MRRDHGAEPVGDRRRLRTVLEAVGLVLSLVVLASSAAGLGGRVRTVELVGLVGGAFGAGAATTAFLAGRRRR